MLSTLKVALAFPSDFFFKSRFTLKSSVMDSRLITGGQNRKEEKKNFVSFRFVGRKFLFSHASFERPFYHQRKNNVCKKTDVI
jgi:hypothetical protein